MGIESGPDITPRMNPRTKVNVQGIKQTMVALSLIEDKVLVLSEEFGD